ncbi:MAG: acyltransferase, partial [archaeon]|nr:acyltransferase [archaeon]
MAMRENKAENLDKALRMIRDAAQRGAQIVCLPELFTSLYFPQDEKSQEKPISVP